MVEVKLLETRRRRSRKWWLLLLLIPAIAFSPALAQAIGGLVFVGWFVFGIWFTVLVVRALLKYLRSK